MMLLQIGVLFGQRGVRKAPDPGTFIGVLITSGLIVLISIIVVLLFYQSLSRCLGQCAARNRTMKPWQVWLNLIPLFGVIWMFITILRISESLKNEFRARRLRSKDPEFAKMTGILFMVSSFICGPISLIFWIMYWVKIVGFKNELKKTTGGDDDDNERPRGGRKKRVADEVDDDERPRSGRRKRVADDDDDDERPRSGRKKRVEDEDDDDARPRRDRGRRDDDYDDDDDRPRRRDD
jgi:hypothetical protein